MMEISDVRALITLMDEGNLTSIRVVEGETEIELRRDPAPAAPAAAPAPQQAGEKRSSFFAD